MNCGECGFKAHDFSGIVCGLIGRPASQREHLGDVRNIGFTNFEVLFFAIVGLVWQAQATLIKVHDIAVWLTWVVIDIGAKQARYAIAAQRTKQGGCVIKRADAANLLQVASNRCGTELVGSRLVHERVIEVADLLSDARRRGCRSLKQNLLHGLFAGVGQSVK